MPATLSPYGELSYGYSLGENGWKTGMDENMLILDALLLGNFGQRRSTSTATTLGLNSGLTVTAGGGLATVTAGTLALTNNATNYVERTTAGVVSANTSGFTRGRIPMMVVTTASGAITDVKRVEMSGGNPIAYLTDEGDGTLVIGLAGGASGLLGSAASGTNVPASNLTVSAPRGTGNAAGGGLVFRTATRGASGTGVHTTDAVLTLLENGGGTRIEGKVGFYGTTPIAQPTVTGSKGANAALTSLLTALANAGLIVDSSS